MTESIKYLLNFSKEIKKNNSIKSKNKENIAEIYSH